MNIHLLYFDTEDEGSGIRHFPDEASLDAHLRGLMAGCKHPVVNKALENGDIHEAWSEWCAECKPTLDTFHHETIDIPGFQLDSRELATVLNALRVFQDILRRDPSLAVVEPGEELPLSPDEINTLCERINQ